MFFKKTHQSLKYYSEGKEDLKRFLIFPNIKMSAKLKKIKYSEKFIVTWREEQSL